MMGSRGWVDGRFFDKSLQLMEGFKQGFKQLMEKYLSFALKIL